MSPQLLLLLLHQCTDCHARLLVYTHKVAVITGCGKLLECNAPHAHTYLNVWLLFDAVDVFMQPIQKESQELLAVMLLVAAELGCKGTNTSLE